MKNNKTLFLLICLLLIVCHTGQAQLTERALHKLYLNDSSEEFCQFLEERNKELKESSVHYNDTLKVISDLFNTIFKDSSRFFFLQSDFPIVEIGGTPVFFSSNFFVETNNKRNSSLVNDKKTITTIVSFIGKDPISEPPFKSIDPKKKRQVERRLQKLLNETENRRKRMEFVSRYVVLPTTWDSLIESLVPYRINYLKFNNKLDEVEIDYSFPARGGTAVYKLDNRGWVEHEVLITWVD